MLRYLISPYLFKEEIRGRPTPIEAIAISSSAPYLIPSVLLQIIELLHDLLRTIHVLRPDDRQRHRRAYKGLHNIVSERHIYG